MLDDESCSLASKCNIFELLLSLCLIILSILKLYDNLLSTSVTAKPILT